MAKILVVEDDTDFSESLAKYLARIGHTPLCEIHGRAGLKTLLKEDPEVVLLDLRMPVMDGFDFLEVLRSYLRLRTFPVFVMCGLLDEEALSRLGGFGVKQVFLKGHFEFEDIRNAIESELNN